ncbi:hypothetical protein ABZ502_17475 [Streptomyces abikoensis]|uniref:hypothetical protein n=1 Tax=Streptomyces abikoensis TaxID=97398 RepID=UPI0033C77618
MTEPVPSPAEATAAAVAADYPGLRQAHPHSIGRPLADVRLDGLSARYSWKKYDVHVTVGPEGHLNTGDVEDQSLQRQVRAHAALLVTEVRDAPAVRGHVEWEMDDLRPEIVFPPAVCAAAADLTDPRLASAVLATVARALDYAKIATGHASERAAEAEEEAQWERERPEGVSRGRWLRQKQAERAARKETPGGGAPQLGAKPGEEGPFGPYGGDKAEECGEEPGRGPSQPRPGS